MDDKTYQYMAERTKAYAALKDKLKYLENGLMQLEKATSVQAIRCHGDSITGVVQLNQEAVLSLLKEEYEIAIKATKEEMDKI